MATVQDHCLTCTAVGNSARNALGPYNRNCPSAGRETCYQRVLTHKLFTTNATFRGFNPRRFRCFPRLRPSRQGPTKLNSTLLAQANTSSSYSQQWNNTKSINVEILPPRYKGGGANTGFFLSFFQATAHLGRLHACLCIGARQRSRDPFTRCAEHVASMHRTVAFVKSSWAARAAWPSAPYMWQHRAVPAVLLGIQCLLRSGGRCKRWWSTVIVLQPMSNGQRSAMTRPYAFGHTAVLFGGSLSMSVAAWFGLVLVGTSVTSHT